MAKLKTISPQFAVPDVKEAAEYYRDALGFTILGLFQEPPVFGMVSRDAVTIHLGKLHGGEAAAPNWTKRDEGLDAYIWTDDVDGLYAELKGRGAKIVEIPTVRLYKCYEMVVEDKLGYRLAFAKDLSGIS